ncbi:hypothetical protein BZA77DRAFT_297893 [Pyronema omphalodes]|nr:hypothetical protein BZA77DRAFT_297893 [Pyronema omphalodes]
MFTVHPREPEGPSGTEDFDLIRTSLAPRTPDVPDYLDVPDLELEDDRSISHSLDFEYHCNRNDRYLPGNASESSDSGRNLSALDDDRWDISNMRTPDYPATTYDDRDVPTNQGSIPTDSEPNTGVRFYYGDQGLIYDVHAGGCMYISISNYPAETSNVPEIINPDSEYDTLVPVSFNCWIPISSKPQRNLGNIIELFEYAAEGAYSDNMRQTADESLSWDTTLSLSEFDHNVDPNKDDGRKSVHLVSDRNANVFNDIPNGSVILVMCNEFGEWPHGSPCTDRYREYRRRWPNIDARLLIPAQSGGRYLYFAYLITEPRPGEGRHLANSLMPWVIMNLESAIRSLRKQLVESEIDHWDWYIDECLVTACIPWIHLQDAIEHEAGRLLIQYIRKIARVKLCHLMHFFCNNGYLSMLCFGVISAVIERCAHSKCLFKPLRIFHPRHSAAVHGVFGMDSITN